MGNLTGNCRRLLLIDTVLKHVGILVFLTSLSSAHTFNTGSLLISSCNPISAFLELPPRPQVVPLAPRIQTHRNRQQQTCPLDLPHMRNAPRLVGLEALYDLPCLAYDAHISIKGPDKEAVGARAHARDLVALKELSGFIVGEVDLGDVEEVKRLPLRSSVSRFSETASRLWRAGERAIGASLPRWPS